MAEASTRSNGFSRFSASENQGFVFISTDPQGKPDVGARKFIRSHVMRGKNTRKKLAARHQDPHPARSSTVSHEAVVLNLATIPRGPSEVTLQYFADEIGPEARGMIMNFFSSIKDVLYPIEQCCDVRASRDIWFQWLFNDPAYLHTLLYTVSCMYDAVAGRPLQQTTRFHIYKSIKYLNQRLATKEFALTDSTTASVITRALIAEAFGDPETSCAHATGLHQMVKLRGGIGAFDHNPQLQMKICRVDLGLAISTGSRPRLFGGSLSWEPFFDNCPTLTHIKPVQPHEGARTRREVKASDERLHGIFTDLQNFSQLASVLFQTGQKLQPQVLNQFLTSVQYRLLHLQFDNSQPMQELLRLAMLAYFATIFLKLPVLQLKYEYLAKQLRTACTAFQPVTNFQRRMYVWILFVGAQAVFDPYEPWLQTALEHLTEPHLGTSWASAKSVLESFMWVGAIHDHAGFVLLRSALRRPGRVDMYDSTGPQCRATDWPFADVGAALMREILHQSPEAQLGMTGVLSSFVGPVDVSLNTKGGALRD